MDWKREQTPKVFFGSFVSKTYLMYLFKILSIAWNDPGALRIARFYHQCLSVFVGAGEILLYSICGFVAGILIELQREGVGLTC